MLNLFSKECYVIFFIRTIKQVNKHCYFLRFTDFRLFPSKCETDIYIFFFLNLRYYLSAILILCGLTFDFSVRSVHSFVKGKENALIEQKNCKGHKKRDRPLVLNIVFNFKISLRNKNYTY